MPAQFWSLTVREFWLKWHAYARTEDRRRSLLFEYLGMTASAQMKPSDRSKVWRSVNQLRRYPLKRWLLPDGPTS
jgi:hypothetical protein